MVKLSNSFRTVDGRILALWSLTLIHAYILSNYAENRNPNFLFTKGALSKENTKDKRLTVRFLSETGEGNLEPIRKPSVEWAQPVSKPGFRIGSKYMVKEWSPH
jgi:hypothetical protein